jgi:predicted alpha/beta-fold hydrolase
MVIEHLGTFVSWSANFPLRVCSSSWWWHAKAGAPVIFFFPGLNNSSRWNFVKCTVHFFLQRGFTVAVLDYRGVSAKLTSARVFGADSWVDIPGAVAAARARLPAGTALHAIGHSMGGAMLVKYLTVCGSECPLVGCRSIERATPRSSPSQ